MCPHTRTSLTVSILGILTSLVGVQAAGATNTSCTSNIVSFEGKGFYQFDDKIISHQPESTIEIEMKISTKSSHGLLLWKRSQTHRDYISLGLVDGFLVFEYYYNRHQHNVTLVSNTRLDDGVTHLIRVSKHQDGYGTLQVDTGEEIRKQNGLTEQEEDVINTEGGPLYMGGLPRNMRIETATFDHYSARYTGCIQYLSIVNTVKGQAPLTVNTEDKEDFYKPKSAGGSLVEESGGVVCVESCGDSSNSGSGTYWAGIGFWMVGAITVWMTL